MRLVKLYHILAHLTTTIRWIVFFPLLGASCPERTLKMTSRASYYFIENQNFKDGSFYIPKTA